jgi:hypothetical protein
MRIAAAIRRQRVNARTATDSLSRSPPTVASTHGRPWSIGDDVHDGAPRSWKKRSPGLGGRPVATEPESESTAAVTVSLVALIRESRSVPRAPPTRLPCALVRITVLDGGRPFSLTVDENLTAVATFPRVATRRRPTVVVSVTGRCRSACDSTLPAGFG